ncbi:MAG: 30S ribosomal protein S12 methylthiotransferase RimO [Verrucomicrobia bacterium]|nr:30S ribosomal protein S12 methylthiotransferase RimO [Verrucomicrobiota bacterium]MBU1910606.1 30S ribosomal protein S12 methylthiotransferase RimO [Verrucomicrobiota bacterium]
MRRTLSAPPPIVSLISLGCSKNTVDSECLLGELVQSGLLIAEDPAESDICLVNTCGFIEEARRETADTLERLARMRKRGRPGKIVALGCLVERAGQAHGMHTFLAQADARVPFHAYRQLPQICRELVRRDSAPGCPGSSAARDGDFLAFLKSPRVRIGGAHSAYLKISEGCSNRCRYCAIPAIRGRQVSRPIEDILSEAGQLIRHGAREINLVAQDTTRYGLDLYGEPRLPELLRKLGDMEAAAWFRLLYAHPAHLSDEVIEQLAGSPHLCPYIDLPLQHIADPLLEAMGRKINTRQTMDLLERIRNKMPQGALRTTFIAGFPGETDAHFAQLLQLVRDGWFMHAGVFTYSCEPGTPAAEWPDDVSPGEKERRRAQLLEAQREVSRQKGQSWVGRTVEVMLDGVTDRKGSLPRNARAVGRTRLQAPEVDGIVLIVPPRPHPAPRPGDRCQVEITEALDYDLVARFLQA